MMRECSLYDLMKYDDSNGDKHLSLDEFYRAFSKYRGKTILYLLIKGNCVNLQRNTGSGVLWSFLER